MGGFLSSAAPRSMINDNNDVSHGETCKKHRMSSCFSEDGPRLIPGLPDEVSVQILSRLPRIHYLNLRLVSRKWKATVTSPELFKLRKELGMTEEWLYVLTKVEDEKLLWHALDPLSRKWQRLPPIPNVIHEEESRKSLWHMVGRSIRIAEFIRGWFVQKEESEKKPFCGCAIGAIDGCLYVLGGFSRTSTISNVWRFNPILNAWSEMTSMSIGRAYCKTSILNNKLYVVGGVSQERGGLIPLQSAEVLDPHTGAWSQVPSMPCSRAYMLPNAFLADMMKPIATGMTSYKGRLCVAQSLYSWPFFFDAGGEIYDPETNSWDDMPSGMGDGWPTRQAATKLSVVVDGELYAVETSSSDDGGKIKVYDQSEDAWKVVIRNVPVTDLANSESPYLLAGFHGRLHVITKDENLNIAVLQADLQNNFCQLPSISTSNSGGSSLEFPDSTAVSETVIWKAIATRDFGPAELVNCQVLEI